jgi:RNA polymerase sigma-70 factor (ECF subfamily)
VDRQQLASLYSQYGYYVHRRCAALLGSSAEADDALQEVFLRVQRYGRPEATGSDLGWLYTIATRVCFDLKGRKKEQTVDPSELPALDGRTSAADGDLRAVVGLALRNMDVKTAELGVMHHLDGYTQEEMAERTGVSRKTIGKKLAIFEALVRQVFSQTSLKGNPPR